MNCTRWTVGRLLDEARESGIVRISINHPRARIRELENELREAFGLRDAVVVKAQGSDAATVGLVAASASDFITSQRPRPGSLGIAWGRTLTAVARAMPDNWTSGLEVYQTYGGLVRSNDDEVADSIGLMARRGRGVGHMLPAPAIVTDAELGFRLRREPSVARTLAAGPSSDLMIYSPGVLEAESVLVKSGFLSENGMERLRSMGAVTDIFSHFLDEDGNPVSKELEARTIAVSLDDIRRSKMLLLVASGPAKVRPTRVAVRSGLAHVVITDGDTAQGILDL